MLRFHHNSRYAAVFSVTKAEISPSSISIIYPFLVRFYVEYVETRLTLAEFKISHPKCANIGSRSEEGDYVLF